LHDFHGAVVSKAVGLLVVVVLAAALVTKIVGHHQTCRQGGYDPYAADKGQTCTTSTGLW
jgi:hypothetical protein